MASVPAPARSQSTVLVILLIPNHRAQAPKAGRRRPGGGHHACLQGPHGGPGRPRRQWLLAAALGAMPGSWAMNGLERGAGPGTDTSTVAVGAAGTGCPFRLRTRVEYVVPAGVGSITDVDIQHVHPCSQPAYT